MILPVIASTLTSSMPDLPGTLKSYEYISFPFSFSSSTPSIVPLGTRFCRGGRGDLLGDLGQANAKESGVPFCRLSGPGHWRSERQDGQSVTMKRASRLRAEGETVASYAADLSWG